VNVATFFKSYVTAHNSLLPTFMMVIYAARLFWKYEKKCSRGAPVRSRSDRFQILPGVFAGYPRFTSEIRFLSLPDGPALEGIAGV
jgi:hypothetical protein